MKGKLRLEFYKLQQTFKGDILLNITIEDTTLENTKTINTAAEPQDEDESLENIIKKINERFKGIYRG